MGALLMEGLWQCGQGSEKRLGQLAQAGCWGCPLGAHPMPSTEGCDLPLSLADGELEAPEP